MTEPRISDPILAGKGADLPRLELEPGASLLRFMLFERSAARALIVACSLFSAVFGLAGPIFQKLFVDRLMGVEASVHWDWLERWPTLAFLAAAFTGLLIGQGLALLSNYLGAREAAIVQSAFGRALYDKMLRLRPDQLGRRTVGETVAIYATDAQGATAILDQTLPAGAAIVFPMILGPLAIHLLFKVPLGATLAVTGFVLLINIFLASRQSRLFHVFKQLAAERSGLVAEWVQNMRALRILGWTERFEDKIFAKRREETAHRVRMVTNGQTMSSLGSSISFFLNLTGVASLVYWRGQGVTAGELLAFLWILGVFLARPFRQIPWAFTFVLDALSSLRRVEAFLASSSAPTGIEPLPAAAAVVPQPSSEAGALALEAAGVNLKIGGQHLLKNVSFKVKAGEFVAIVGEVGSGKSLLALALMGETGATFERYQLLGADATSMEPGQRRMHFSYVAQEGFVMSATLRENVAFEYDTSESYDPAILASLENAQFPAAREIGPQGLGTEIGERGVNLSGGQRQRVSLARADFFDRPVVLLDDALSAVDVDTENRLVDDLIRGRWGQKTRVLITHRLSVLEHVDRILYMEAGTIVAQGRLNELMMSNPRFRQFVATIAKEEAEPVSEAPRPEEGLALGAAAEGGLDDPDQVP